MATIINDPDTRTVERTVETHIHSTEDSGAGLILGVIIAIILIALFFLYGLPALRGSNTTNNSGNTNTPAPTNNSAGINVQLPPTQSQQNANTKTQ